jgi:hypothetical protein
MNVKYNSKMLVLLPRCKSKPLIIKVGCGAFTLLVIIVSFTNPFNAHLGCERTLIMGVSMV